MAQFPFDPNIGSKVSQQLTDIASKLDHIKSYEMIDVNIRLPHIDDIDKSLDKQMKNIEKVKKVWKAYGADLEKITIHFRNLRKEMAKKAEQLIKLDDAYDDMMAKQAAGIKLSAEELIQLQKIIKERVKVNKELDEYRKKTDPIYEQELKAIALRKQGTKSLVEFAEKGFGFLAKFGLSVVTKGLRVMEDALSNAYDMQERYMKASGALAAQLGGATPVLDNFNDAANKLRSSPLGIATDMSIAEAAGEIGAFNTSIGVLDKSLMENQVELISHAKAIGLTSSEAGGAAKSFLMMGLHAKELEKTFTDLKDDALVLGVQSAALSKNLLVAGKNLLALAGPKLRREMTRTINTMFQMGIAAQTVEKFTDMTDSFDKTAESMAKLNTLYGTHINALEVFAENDPKKRWDMISQAIRNQGLTLDNLTRREKKNIGELIGLNADETNALIKGGRAGLTAQQKKAQNWEETISNMQSTLVAWSLMFDNITKSMMRAFSSLFDAFGLNMSKNKKGVRTFGSIVGEVGNNIIGMFDKLANDESYQGFRNAMKQMGSDITALFDKVMTWLKSDEFPKVIENLAVGFKDIPKKIGVAFDILVGKGDKPGLLQRLSWLLGEVEAHAEKFVLVWGAFKVAGFITSIGSLIAAFMGLGFALAPILLTITAIAAAVAAIGAGMWAFKTYFDEKEKSAALDKKHAIDAVIFRDESVDQAIPLEESRLDLYKSTGMINFMRPNGTIDETKMDDREKKTFEDLMKNTGISNEPMIYHLNDQKDYRYNDGMDYRYNDGMIYRSQQAAESVLYDKTTPDLKMYSSSSAPSTTPFVPGQRGTNEYIPGASSVNNIKIYIDGVYSNTAITRIITGEVN